MDPIRLIFAICIIICIPLGSSGQYGPFGIGNSDGTVAPTGYTQPKLLLWLDGSEVQTSSGFVTQWTDKSGNGHHFIPAVANNRPVFQASSGPASTPCLSFDGVDDRLVCSNMEMTGNGFSIYCIFKTSDDFFGFYSYGTASDPDTVLVYNNNGIIQRMGSAERNSQVGDESTGGWEYFGMWWNRDDNRLWEYEAGSSSSYEDNNSFANGFLYNTSGEAVIGDIPLAGGGYETNGAFQGQIAEIIIWEGHMTRPIARMMRTYIWTKYGQNSGNLFREGNAGWDKFQGYASGSGGEYYNTIAVGRDAGGNPGEHCESRLEGLILRVNKDPSSEWNGSRRYMCAGWVPDGGNSIVGTNLPAGVDARWSRVWEIGSRDDGNQRFRIGFDFGEGIDGDIPQVADNFVLLRRTGNTGNFAIVPESQYIERSIVDDEVVFRLLGSNIDDNNRFYTIGTKNAAVSSLDGSTQRTWYAYQSGNWSSPTTWTLDGSAAPSYVNPGSNIPAGGDNVVIGSGRVVMVDIGSISQSNLTVDGTLDVGTQAQPSFTAISGSGLIRAAGNSGSSNFPLGATSNFADASTGGRVEFYGAGNWVQSTSLELNDVEINFNSSSQILTLASNLTHNGSLTISRGTLTINNTANTPRTINSFGNVIIENQGRIRTNSGGSATKHTWSFYQNLINDGGDIRFTNRTTPAYTSNETQQWIATRFVSANENQDLIANGTSYFSRLIVNKGNDMTYILSVSSSNSNYFKLLGPCNQSMGSSSFIQESSQSNALSLINGTIEIRENIFIPLHASGGNYNINNTAMLWVNGGSAAKGAPQVPGGSNSTAIVPYGTIKVSDGELYANCNSGITTRENGLIQLDGGYLFANQIRTSVLGVDNIGGVIINGGLLEVDGNSPGGANGSYYTFSLTYPGNLFRMTGGELRVAGPTGRGLIFINSDPEQTNVSGGTVIAEVQNTSNNHKISSRVPFWNLEIERTSTSSTNRAIRVEGGSSGGGSETATIVDQELVVNNNLTITGANAATLDMNDEDLFVQGDFTIQTGGIYDHGLNTTYFFGNANSLLTLPTSATIPFNNLSIDKDTDTRFAEIITGNSTRAIEVQGTMILEKGYFENNSRNVSLLGDIINKSSFGTSTSTGYAICEGTLPQTITSSNGIFHTLRLDNSAGATLEGDDLVVRRLMQILSGVFDLQSYKLRIEAPLGSLSVSGPNINKCFVTDGNASSGGLEVAFKTASQQTTFPIGVKSGSTVEYTPAIVRINSGFVDTGYVRVAPVDTLLLSADITGPSHYLNFYWKVLHSEFENIPNVSHRFQYLQADVIGDEDSLASGRVLSENPFTRSVDSTLVFDDNMNIVSNWIFYNGPAENGTITGVGTPLVNADYTAGHRDRFTGSPEIYYSKSAVTNATWNTPGNWTSKTACIGCTDPFDYHSSTAPSASDYPQAGDIAFIGFNPANGKPHVYLSPSGGIEANLVAFTPLQDIAGNPQPRYFASGSTNLTVLRPTLSIGATAEIEKIGSISGEGALKLRNDIDLDEVDIGNFLVEDSSIIIVESASTLLEFTTFPADIPNLFITSDNNGSNIRTTRIRNDISIRGDLEIVGRAKLLLNSGSTGDILVGDDLKLARYQSVSSGPELRFNSDGNPRIVDVRGNIEITDPGSTIRVLSPNSTPQIVHELVAWQDILQNNSSSTGLNLFSDLTEDYVVLTLRGEGNHQFQNLSGNTPILGKLRVDKGLDISSGFTFQSDVNIDGPSDQTEKSIELLNGLLEMDDPGIDITLSSGGGDFSIPSTAGLELADGTLRINGVETGLLLDGLLRIDGGQFLLGDTDGENNYIEYSSTGTAEIEVISGTLSVGSQVRRGLTNIAGVLNYNQSGGTVNLGVYSSPATSRGILEVVNSGSQFVHTGGTINFYRGINSSSTPSLLLEPDFSNIGTTSQIVIGHLNSPSGGPIQNFGIQSEVALNALEINNDSGNDPVIRIQVFDLELNGLLEIDASSELRCENRNLITTSDILNNGLLESTSGEVILNHSIIGSVSGSGTFDLFDLERTGGGITNVSSSLTVKNDFTLDAGDMDFSSNTLSVKRNATIDGHLIFNSSSNGLIMDGTGSQLLRRSSSGTSFIDAITIDNASGVDMINGAGYEFVMDKDLRLSSGVFDLKGNLLELGVNSNVIPVNAYDNNNMISTGGAFTNFGVRKKVSANNTDEYLIPLGIDVYMPVSLDFSDVGYSSGNLESEYLIKLNVPRHPVIVQDVEVPGPQINDFLNVLGMYFSLDASSVGTGLVMRAIFQYSDDYVNVTSPNTEADYIGAQIIDDGSPSPPIIKLPGAVDDVNNTITFEYNNVDETGIDGDYFAGIDNAIPDFVPLYQTTRDGDVDEGFFPGGVYDSAVIGGGTPNGSVVWIRNDDELTLNVDGVNFYKTIIDPDAVLIIDETSFHRLGTVEGEGTIRLVGTGDLPAGIYNDFFTCTGGKLEFEGNGTSYEILANLPVVRSVTLSGSGTMNIANNDVSICENLDLNGPDLNAAGNATMTITGDLLLQTGTLEFGTGNVNILSDFTTSGTSQVDAGNEGTLSIEGDLNIGGNDFSFGNLYRETRLRGDLFKTSGNISGGTNGAPLIFDGSSQQELTGDFTGSGDQLRVMEIDNSAGLSLNSSVDIVDTLFLTNGLINTSASAKLILANNGVDVVPEGGSQSSFINGPMDWVLSSGTTEPKFPVGKNDRFRPLVLTNRSATRTWTVEYYDTLALVEPAVISLDPLDPGLIRTVSIQEYWSINSNTASATTARVGLSWGDNSAVSTSPSDYQKLVVLAYNESNDLWDSYGANGSSFSYDVGSNQGEFLSNSALSFTEKYVTLGSRDDINPLPVSWLYFEGETDESVHILRWATATEIENDYFVLERSVNANDWVK